MSATPVEWSDTTSERPPRQHQRRLQADELKLLLADYAGGVEICEMARRYRINRRTVIRHVRRQGVRMRHPKLGLKDVERAAQLYKSGKSLAQVGAVFAVDAETIRRVLTKADVPMRDQHGRRRQE